MNLKEARDIVISAVVLAIAFGIAFSGGLWGSASTDIVNNVLLALLAVSLSFILHELGHRTIAKKYGCFAEYQMWPFGLVIALMVSFTGFVFAAPGAVVIHSKIDVWGNVTKLSRKSIGLISLAGPAINLALAGCFAAANLLLPLGVFAIGITINLWLALFNILPVPPLDGSKIFFWDKRIWAGFFVAVVALFALSIFYL
ncbi:MAG: site-2 protease family protein [Candidatus Aenigmarchaeota archaeon]|nr:site-2 protease family protein [Candidatus Aenigmarchaeota archaeon]